MGTAASLYGGAAVFCIVSAMTRRKHTGPPEGLDGWHEVWTENLYQDSPPLSYLETQKQRLRRRLAREATDERQRDFNLATLELIRDLRKDIAAFAETRREFAATTERFAQDLKRLEALQHLTIDRNDALVIAVDQKIESVAARLRDVTQPLLEVSLQRAETLRSDLLYRRLEEGLRGSEEKIRELLSPYVDLAAGAQPVIDVGCGRGEFLQMCRSREIEARGFDLNERSVAELAGSGLKVQTGGLPECLQSVESSSVGMLFASHVVEHLPVNDLFGLFGEAQRVLRIGGLFVIETPNAESLSMSARDFWRDPTHLAPRHPAALSLLAREFGFGIREAVAVHPPPADSLLASAPEDSERTQELVSKLNALLFGGQDLRMILIRER